MFRREEWQRQLLGIFEIAIFMRRGVERFTADLDSALRSFVWPALMLPIAVVTASLMSVDASFSSLLALHFFRILLTFTLSLGLIFFVTKKIDRSQHLYRYITTANWFEIAMFIMVLPILGVLVGGGAVESVETYAIFITCLGIVYSGFILTHTLRIPWELATLLAVSLLFIDETGFNILEFIKSGVATAV